jgi:hypothetical protein
MNSLPTNPDKSEQIYRLKGKEVGITTDYCMSSMRSLSMCLLVLSFFPSLVTSAPPVSGPAVSITPISRKLAITLSGSNLGNCVVDGPCFSSLPYDNSEVCEFTTDVAGVLSVVSFATGEKQAKGKAEGAQRR